MRYDFMKKIYSPKSFIHKDLGLFFHLLNCKSQDIIQQSYKYSRVFMLRIY